MGIDTHVLDAGQVYSFQIRLALGTIAPVAPAPGVRDLEAMVRRAGEALGRRAAQVADVLHALDERGWRPQHVAPTGREVLAGHGFADLEGSVLPEAVAVVKDGLPAEVARDLRAVERELSGELAESLTVRVEDLDLPVALTAESAELRYSPREYLETFSIRD